jgi:hypothetical protein
VFCGITNYGSLTDRPKYAHSAHCSQQTDIASRSTVTLTVCIGVSKPAIITLHLVRAQGQGRSPVGPSQFVPCCEHRFLMLHSIHGHHICNLLTAGSSNDAACRCRSCPLPLPLHTLVRFFPRSPSLNPLTIPPLLSHRPMP